MKQTLKLCAIALFLLGCGYLSESNFNDLKADQTATADITFDEAVNAGYFQYSTLADSICGVDQQGTDMWCEIATNGNQKSFTLNNNK